MERGTRIEPSGTDARSRNPLMAFGRLLGFLVLAAPAIVILAGVILLPVYERLCNTRYEYEKLKAQVADAEKRVRSNDLLIEGLASDPVMTKRTAMNATPLVPHEEVVVHDPTLPRSTPGVIEIPRTPPPQPPNSILYRLGVRLEKPATRRGLFLLAAGAMLVALFIFAPPQQRKEDVQDQLTA